MTKPERNRDLLRNFILHLTHSSHPNDGEDLQFKVPMTFTPELLYKVVDEYIEEDHVDGYGAEKIDVYDDVKNHLEEVQQFFKNCKDLELPDTFNGSTDISGRNRKILFNLPLI